MKEENAKLQNEKNVETNNKPIKGFDEIVYKDGLKEYKIPPFEETIYKAFREGISALSEEEIELLKNPSKEEKEQIKSFNGKIIMMYQEVLKALGTNYITIINNGKESNKEDEQER